MTRRGLFGSLLLLRTPRNSEQRATETYDLSGGWKRTDDMPAWLKNEVITEANVGLLPPREFTIITRIHR